MAQLGCADRTIPGPLLSVLGIVDFVALLGGALVLGRLVTQHIERCEACEKRGRRALRAAVLPGLGLPAALLLVCGSKCLTCVQAEARTRRRVGRTGFSPDSPPTDGRLV